MKQLGVIDERQLFFRNIMTIIGIIYDVASAR